MFHQRTSQFKELTKTEVNYFLEIINNKQSYGNTTAACHEPQTGLVFYDAQGTPCSYLSLCMRCNNIYTSPKLQAKLSHKSRGGFSLKTRKKLHKVFEVWGYPNVEYSFLFDDYELFERSLEHEKLTQNEIKEKWNELHCEE